MKSDIKAKWLDALRSGKYEQETGALRVAKDDGKVGYCCLGVLCDVLDPDGWSTNTEDIQRGDERETVSVHPFTWKNAPDGLVDEYGDPYSKWEFRESTELPAALRKYAEVRYMDDLVKMNDTDKATFEEIAKFIEVNL